MEYKSGKTISHISEVHECKSSPCMNGGSCEDKVNSYECSCVGGYTGEHCESGKIS